MVDLKQLAVDRIEPARSIEPPRHILSRYVLPGVLLIGFLSVLGWATRDAFLPRHDVKVVPVYVSLDEIQQAGTPLFKAAGWVEPRPTPIRVAALAEGVIDRLLVVEDQAVRKGEPIAYLIDDDSRLSLDGARAVLRIREAELDQCQAALAAAILNFDEPTHLQAVAAAAEAAFAKTATELTDLPFRIDEAAARAKFADADLKAKVEAGDAVTEIEVDEARSVRDAAKAKLDELRRRRSSLELEHKALGSQYKSAVRRLELKTDEKKDVGEARAILKAAEARLQQARILVSVAQLEFDRMTIRAPVDGRVMHLLTSPGTRLLGSVGRADQNDGGVVVTLYQPDKLQVRVDVRFEDLPQTGRNYPVLVESPAVKLPMSGTVLFTTSFADIQKNTLSVKVVIDDPPDVLKPEMLVDVTFLSPESNDDGAKSTDDDASPLRVFVPRRLVRNDDAGTFVWGADQTAQVARRMRVVVAEHAVGHYVEVTSGLTVASRLIASGSEGLADGARINITGEAEPEGRQTESAGKDP